MELILGAQNIQGSIDTVQDIVHTRGDKVEESSVGSSETFWGPIAETEVECIQRGPEIYQFYQISCGWMASTGTQMRSPRSLFLAATVDTKTQAFFDILVQIKWVKWVFSGGKSSRLERFMRF